MGGVYDADLLGRKQMIKMRGKVVKIGISTERYIEVTIAENAFQVRSVTNGVEDITEGFSHGCTIVKLKAVPKASAIKLCSSTAAIDESAELDASVTAILQALNIEADKPAELEAFENVIITQSSSNTAVDTIHLCRVWPGQVK